MNNSVESSNNGQGSQSSARAADSSMPHNSKANYTGVVAQRALYGSYKRRVVGGKRIGIKSGPSRLSNVSASDCNSS